MRNPILAMAEKWRRWSKAQRGLVVMLAVGLSVVVFGNRLPRMEGPKDTAVSAYPPVDYQANYPLAPGPERADALDENERKMQDAASTKEELQRNLDRLESTRAGSQPLIAHTAELTVATKEFTRSRGLMEEILERHRGYAARLRMVGQKSGSVLNATLRVPSTELTGTVSDLKTLGDVEREEQAADEITQQRADLEARLTNAQNALRRLQELLKKQTYPDGNVRSLQQQIANASAEVSRLEAERQASEHRVVFANVQFSLREEQASPDESLSAQLRKAASAGFGEAAVSLSALLVFLIGRGPVVVLWAAILWFPARLVWRKWAPVTAQPSAAASGS